MDLRELRYFIYIAELKSFSKASQQLRIAQPALSRQVKKLEDELGVQLFVRAGRGLQMTEAGALFLQRARGLLRQVSQMMDDVRARQDTLSGTVTLGVVPAAGSVLMPPVVRRCADRFPGVRINVVEGFSGFLYERLINQELTFSILHNPQPARDLEVQRLLIDHVHLVGPGREQDLLPTATPTLAAAIERLPLILPSRPNSLRMLVETSLAERGLAPDIRHEVSGLTMIKALVRAGVGYTVLTFGAIADEVEAGSLSSSPLQPETSWTLCAALRRETAGSPVVQAVLGIVRTEVRRLVDQGRWRGTPQYLPEETADDPPLR